MQNEHLSSSVGVLDTDREETRRKLQHEFAEKPAPVDDAGSIGCGSGKWNDSEGSCDYIGLAILGLSCKTRRRAHR